MLTSHADADSTKSTASQESATYTDAAKSHVSSALGAAQGYLASASNAAQPKADEAAAKASELADQAATKGQAAAGAASEKLEQAKPQVMTQTLISSSLSLGSLTFRLVCICSDRSLSVELPSGVDLVLPFSNAHLHKQGTNGCV